MKQDGIPTQSVDRGVQQATAHRRACFRVTEAEFDAILQRIRDAGIPFRGVPHGPDDNAVNERMGGRVAYWNEPDGHVWEILTRSYGRAPR